MVVRSLWCVVILVCCCLVVCRFGFVSNNVVCVEMCGLMKKLVCDDVVRLIFFGVCIMKCDGIMLCVLLYLLYSYLVYDMWVLCCYVFLLFLIVCVCVFVWIVYCIDLCWCCYKVYVLCLLVYLFCVIF